jgi:hypothetical protein
MLGTIFMFGTRVALARTAAWDAGTWFSPDLVWEESRHRPDWRTCRAPQEEQTRSRGAIRQLKPWLQTRQSIMERSVGAPPWPVETSVWCDGVVDMGPGALALPRLTRTARSGIDHRNIETKRADKPIPVAL